MFQIIIEIVTDVTREYGPYVGLLTGLFYLIWQSKTKIFNKWRRNEAIDDKVKITVKCALHSILWKLEADRVFLFEFIEYDPRFQPIPFGYTNNTVEILNPSTTAKPQIENLQRIPLPSIPFWIEKLSEEGEVCLHDIENIRHQDPTTYEILKHQQIKSCYAVSLVDFRGCPLGFVGVDYCKDWVVIEDWKMEILKYEALKIAGLLVMQRNGSLKHVCKQKN